MDKIKVLIDKQDNLYVAKVPTITEIMCQHTDRDELIQLVKDSIEDIREQREAMNIEIPIMAIPKEYELELDEFYKNFGIVTFPAFAFNRSAIRMKQEIFKFVTPVRSIMDDSRFQAPRDKMLCYCDKFREVKDGEVTPEYMVTIHTNEKGEATGVDVEEIPWRK